VTTEKDIARLRNNAQLSSFAAVIEVFAVTLVVENAQILRDFMAERLGKARSKRR
jgi:tetraacyldisaccharide 4'-kinase